MERRDRIRAYKRALGAALAVLGVTVWAISAALPVTSRDHRDVSIGHLEDRSIGVIGGGVVVLGGVILLASAV
jgi:hypothetical protein